MPKSAQRHFLVAISNIAGTWSRKSGGEITAETTKVWDGGRRRPDVIAAPSIAGNITVGRPWDPARDAELARRLKQQVGSRYSTISITPTDVNMVALRNAEVYPDALLIRVTTPDVDASSGDAAELELEFEPGDFV